IKDERTKPTSNRLTILIRALYRRAACAVARLFQVRPTGRHAADQSSTRANKCSKIAKTSVIVPELSGAKKPFQAASRCVKPGLRTVANNISAVVHYLPARQSRALELAAVRRQHSLAAVRFRLVSRCFRGSGSALDSLAGTGNGSLVGERSWRLW